MHLQVVYGLVFFGFGVQCLGFSVKGLGLTAGFKGFRLVPRGLCPWAGGFGGSF